MFELSPLGNIEGVENHYSLKGCYATPQPLWRETRNLQFFIEPSFAFSALLSLYLLLIALSFLFPLGGCMLAQGLAISACTHLINKGGNGKLQFPPLLNNLQLYSFFVLLKLRVFFHRFKYKYFPNWQVFSEQRGEVE